MSQFFDQDSDPAPPPAVDPAGAAPQYVAVQEVDDHDHDHAFDEGAYDPSGGQGPAPEADHYGGGDDHDYVELPPHGGSGRKVLLVLAILVALLIGVGGFAYLWYDKQVNPGGSQGPVVAVDIPSGATTSGIGPLLVRNKVIVSDTVWGFYVSRKSPPSLLAGHYLLRQHSSYGQVLDALKAGPVKPKVVRVTFPEGFRLRQITERLIARVPQITRADINAVLASNQLRSQYQPAGQTSLEGMLFPATYDIGTDDDAGSVLRNMVSTMDGVVADLGIPAGGAALAPRAGRALTPYEVITVASLIQSEAGSIQEMPKVAAVIYNRLKLGMPLGIDATSRYEALLKGTPINFNSKSSYNTRRQVGLPPTPISNPGRDALRAAVNPDPGNWLYYVLEAPGRHFFTADAAAFQRAVRACHAQKLGC